MYIKMQPERNLRRWIELLSDYDCTIGYHPGKERRTKWRTPLSYSCRKRSVSAPAEYVAALTSMKVLLSANQAGRLEGGYWVRPNLRERIIEAQTMDKEVLEIKHELNTSRLVLSWLTLRQGDRLYVPQALGMKFWWRLI